MFLKLLHFLCIHAGLFSIFLYNIVLCYARWSLCHVVCCTPGNWNDRNMQHAILLSLLCFHGSTALVGQGLLIIEISRSHSDTPHWVGLLRTSDRPDAETTPYNTQHPQGRDIHATGGIRTRNPSKRAAAGPRLRPRGHWAVIFILYFLY